MIKVVALSDTHGKHKDVVVPDGDILLFAGDANLETIRSTKSFFKWFMDHPHTIKVIVAGNHDRLPCESPVFFEELCKEEGITYLKDTIVKERTKGAFYLEDGGFTAQFLNDSLKIYGSPWTRTFYNWYFMKSELELRDCWNDIPIDTDILVTHSPPKNINDKNMDGYNLGCTFLLQKVNFEMALGKPRLHVYGHIHPNSENDRRRHADDKFRNVSVLDENYKLQFQPTTIYL